MSPSKPPVNPGLDKTMTPTDFIEWQVAHVGPMDPRQPGLRTALTLLRQREIDADVTFVAIPNAAIRNLHAAWTKDDPRALTAAVRDAFRGMDGELTNLPKPSRR